MDLLLGTKEYQIFNTKTVRDLIKFKWDTYGFKFHLISFVNHFMFLAILIAYIYQIYILDSLYKLETDPQSEDGFKRV